MACGLHGVTFANIALYNVVTKFFNKIFLKILSSCIYCSNDKRVKAFLCIYSKIKTIILWLLIN